MSDEFDNFVEERNLSEEIQNTFKSAGLPEGYVRQLCFYILEGKEYQQNLDTAAGFFYQSRYSKGELEGHQERIRRCIQKLLIHGSRVECEGASPINFYPSLTQEILGTSTSETTPFFIKTENVKSLAFLLEEFLVLQEAIQYHTRTDFDNKRMRGCPLPNLPDFDIAQNFIGRSIDDILDYNFLEVCQKNQIPDNDLERESMLRINFLNLWIDILIRMINKNKKIFTEKQKEKFIMFQSRLVQAREYIAFSKNVPNNIPPTETIIK